MAVYRVTRLDENPFIPNGKRSKGTPPYCISTRYFSGRLPFVTRRTTHVGYQWCRRQRHVGHDYFGLVDGIR